MKLFELKNPIYRRCSKVIFLAAFLLFIYAIFFMPEKKVYSQTIMFSTMSTLASAKLYLPESDGFDSAFQNIIHSVRQMT